MALLSLKVANAVHNQGGRGMTAAVWGATPAEWQAFRGWGITEDLLPVVSNPQATISPNSKMRDLGKTPSRYNRDRHAVGISQWTRNYSTDEEVARWQRESDLGICVQTRLVRAVDIDITDADFAQRVRDTVELLVGRLPVRHRQNSSKCLLAFKMAGEHSKRIIRTERGIIEFLANGQQFVAAGTHPSGARYQWEGGLAEDVPYLTLDEFNTVWAALASEFGESSTEVRAPVTLTQQRLADDVASDEVVEFLHRTGWVRSVDNQGRVHIRCPWVNEHTSDMGDADTSTTYFPRGVGGIALGHFKCQHAHCQEAGRTDGDFLEAVGYAQEDFQVIEAAEGEDGVAEPPPWPAFTRDRGRIQNTASNTELALQRPDFTGASLAYDAFKDDLLIAWEGESEWRPLRDNDYFRLLVALERRGFHKPSMEFVRRGVPHVGEQNRFDSAIDWAKGLVWDGVPRVAGFLHRYFGTADTDYARAVSVYIWTALAGRCLVPGVKADMVPILVGKQGVGKTRGVSALVPEPGAFVEINLEHRDDNLARSMRGKLVGELGELRGLRGRESESIKAWISRTHEEWTPKYMERATRFPRRLLLIGTTNENDILGDATGERRWLPIDVGVADVEAIERDRDQLWAEGAAMFAAEGVQWQEAQMLAVDEHHKFKQQDPWAWAVVKWLSDPTIDGAPAGSGFSTAEVLEGALGLHKSQVNSFTQRRVGAILRELGFEEYDARRRVGTKKVGQRRAWRPAKNCEFAENNEFDDLA